MEIYNKVAADFISVYSGKDKAFLPDKKLHEASSLLDLSANILAEYYAYDLKECINYLKEQENLGPLEELLALDLEAVVARDPACKNYAFPILFLKGFHGVFLYRLANFAITSGHSNLAYRLQLLMCTSLGIDINPRAIIGEGLFLDHATGIVIGETAVLGKNVSILQSVTLGGTGKEVGKRHPNIGNGVLLGAGCKVLGNISIGNNVKVAAGSIVLHDIPDNVTVVGAPAKVVSKHPDDIPSLSMDQSLI